jgi:hypothetical protein
MRLIELLAASFSFDQRKKARMVTVVVCPQDGASSQQRRYALPSCAFAILEQLQKAAPQIEAAQGGGEMPLKLVFDIRGRSAKAQLTTFFD